ncbi:MAG: metallophosphoesterase [Akkermansia sp.]|nr:metallophosphoesterase [Akkermansia sp.]
MQSAQEPPPQPTAVARPWWRRLVKRLMVWYIAAMLSLFAVAYIFFAEPLRITVEEVPVTMRGWEQGSAPARVVLLADLHAGWRDAAWLDRIVARTLEQKPEAVLLLGDYFSALKLGDAMPVRQIAARLAPLTKHCPVYYVCGNHDMGKAGAELRREFKKKGFVCMENSEHVLTFANGQRLRLRGVAFMAEPFKITPRAGRWQEQRFAKEKLPQDMPLLVATHNPYYFLNHRLCVDLAVAGHTHGGQVCLPGGRPWAALAPWTPQTTRAGMHRNKSGCPVYVSRGLGLSRLPIRLCCPPEITVLLLQGK